MEKTWKPTVAGILTIIAGVIVIIPGIAGALFLDFTSVGYSNVIGVAGLIIILVGIIIIVGGIYALRRRIWRLALVGSIFAFIAPVTVVILVIFLFAIALSPDYYSPDLTTRAMHTMMSSIWYLIVGFGIPGILAIIFVVRGKREFK